MNAAGGVAADGSTILNVYYRRMEYVVRLYGVNSNGVFSGNIYDDNVNVRPASTEPYIKFSARAGEWLRVAAKRALGHELPQETLDLAGWIWKFDNIGYSDSVHAPTYTIGTSFRIVEPWDLGGRIPQDGVDYGAQGYI